MSIDPRLIERRKTVAEDNAKRSVSRLLKFLASMLVVGAVVWIVFSPWLSVSQVSATGIAASGANTLLVEHGVTAGTPMILIDATEVETALERDPWVAEADIRLDWPDTVAVDVVERLPLAWVKTEGGWTRRAVDGVALPSGPEPDAEMARINMPGLSDDEAESSAELLGALEFVGALPLSLHRGTVVDRRDGEMWAKVSGFDVRLGRPVEMTEKALSLHALLAKGIAEGSSVVLIAPTNPAVEEPAADAGTDDGNGTETSNEDDGGDGETGKDSDDDS